MARHTLELGFAGDKKAVDIEVADGTPVPWGLDTPHTEVGERIPRVEARDKVTGRAKYTYDINLPGLLHARVLVSPHPCARVESIDATAALAMSGVRAVSLATDPDWPVGRQIKHEGQEVAAVAADSIDIAADALERIVVRYAVEPHVTDEVAALAPGAPQVHERTPGNTDAGRGQQQGDRDAAFAASSKKIEETYRTQVQNHTALEPHGSVAHWEGDRLTVWCSTQGTFSVLDNLARHFKIPQDKIVVLCHHMGGGFGAKFGAAGCDRLAVLLAKRTGKPVKLMYHRREEHLLGGNRPSSRQTLGVGATAEGEITYVDVDTSGAVGVAGSARCATPIIYRYRAANKRERNVYLHTPASCAFRAPGHPQGVFAFEMAIDELALALGLDPLAMRRKNDPNPVRAAQYALGAEKFEWATRYNKAPGAGGPLVRGIGVAATQWGQLGGPGTEAMVRVHADGKVEVFSGAQDIGTGTRTAMAILTAEELGLAAHAVASHIGDTRWPVGTASGGSRTLPSLGPAVREAAHNARAKLLAIVGSELGAPVSELSLAGGHVVRAGKRVCTWAEACARIPKATGRIDAVGARQADIAPYQRTVAGVQFAEVEVDLRTGVVRCTRVLAIQDCGTVINRLAAESQIAGGVIGGLAYALFEDRVLDPRSGRMLNADLEWYKLPGMRDTPEITAIAFDVSNGANTCGIAGLGEPTTIPTASAIGNAIANATGVRVRSLPFTPDKVQAAIDARRSR